VFSLACVLFASLLQLWVRRYLQITQGLRNPQQRMRIRELMAQALDKYHLPWVASALPALFHISIFLFLAGHVLSLSNINRAVFMLIFTCVGVCAALYLCFSLSPILRYDSPYYTPLSSLIWSCMVGFPWLILKFIYRVSERLTFISYRARLRVLDLARIFHRRTFMGIMKGVEDLAQSCASELDTPAILRMFDSLGGDEDMVKFLVSIPGFYGSNEVEKDSQVLEHLNSVQLPSAIVSFMDRSWSSNLLSEDEKRRRIEICLDAINADPLLLQCTFRQTLYSMRSSIFECIDFILDAESHNDNLDPWTKHYARCIVAVTINRVHDSNDDDKLLNFISIARDLRASYLTSSDQFEPGKIWHNVLSEALKFNARDIAPEFWHHFCALWNDLVDVTHDPQGFLMAKANAKSIISLISPIYLSLHQGISSRDPALPVVAPYSRCDVMSHQPPPSYTCDPVSILPSAAEKVSDPEPTQSTQELTSSSTGCSVDDPVLPDQVEPPAPDPAEFLSGTFSPPSPRSQHPTCSTAMSRSGSTPTLTLDTSAILKPLTDLVPSGQERRGNEWLDEALKFTKDHEKEIGPEDLKAVKDRITL
jgi:Family of unknown function (DUF6535)